jgi:hypothetical protein
MHAPHALVVVQTFTGIEFGTMACLYRRRAQGAAFAAVRFSLLTTCE